jgi:hypothetical protein
MFRISPSPDRGANVCFASPSSASVATRARTLGAAKAISDDERRWGSLSSLILGLSAAVMGQIEINWQEMFRNSPSPDRGADVCFASSSASVVARAWALSTMKALSENKRRWGSLSSLISRMSVVAAMGQIGIDWKEMFQNSPSPNRRADVCFASPSLASVAMRAQALGATKALSDNDRRWGSLSSLISGLSAMAAMGQIGIDWKEMFRNSPSPDCGADVCFASPSLASVATPARALGAAKALSDDERRRGSLSLILGLSAMATMGQIEIDWKEMFRSSPSPDHEADLCFASPSSVSAATRARTLGVAMTLSGDERRWCPLFSPIRGLSKVAAMGRIEIDWVEMFHSSPSPDHEAGVGFASPSSASAAMHARVLGVAKVLSGDKRRLSPLSSPISWLSGIGGDGVDQDQFGGDVSQLTLP